MKILSVLVFILLSFSVQSQSVYKTPSGKKYHLANCRMVNNVSEKLSISEALSIGLEPCKICNPPVTSSSNASAANKAKGEGTTVQCKGITKNGTRCKHMTSIANGYCFQHGPNKAQ